METRLRHNPPVVHWCVQSDEYLNIPVDDDGHGRRLGECPYCNVLIWQYGAGASGGRKGGALEDANGGMGF